MIRKVCCHLLKATQYSWQGLQWAIKQELAFQIEVGLSLVLIPLGLWLGHGATQKALLIMSWLLLPVIEMLNSALETTIDRISLERHPLSGRAKDFGSAAIFMACVNLVCVWAIILLG